MNGIITPTLHQRRSHQAFHKSARYSQGCHYSDSIGVYPDEEAAMRKRLVSYRKRIDKLLNDAPSETNWNEVIQEHLVQVAFFQHERLIHLLVTLAFALMELGSAITAMITAQPLAAILALLLLALLVPYIVHYYFLENETQKLYAQYDRMLELDKQPTTHP